MITEETIIAAFNRYRSLIGKTESIPVCQTAPSGVTYAHFKAAYLMANYIDLRANGFSEDCWQGNVINGVVSGEDLL